MLTMTDDVPRPTSCWSGCGAGSASAPCAGCTGCRRSTSNNTSSTRSLDDWREGLRRRVKLLFRLLRDRYDDFTAGTFLVTGTRLGGEHGYGPDVTTAPMGGGVVGLAKAFKRERPDVLVKAVDFPMSRKKASLADVLIDETLRDPGCRRDRAGSTNAAGRSRSPSEPSPTTTRESRPTPTASSSSPGRPAASCRRSSATSPAPRAAPSTSSTSHLAPDPSDPDVAGLRRPPRGAKRTIFERLKEAGERATPAASSRSS